mgnify:CR=1 FL=1
MQDEHIIGLTGAEVAERRARGEGETGARSVTKSVGAILRENICTLFNALNFAIAIILFMVGAYTNMLFIAIIILNIVIGIAQELGCDLTKVFPAGNVGGPSFVKNVKAPLPWAMLMATGAVEPQRENLEAWFGAGVDVVGMGSKLFPAADIAEGRWDAITERCREALAIIAAARRKTK